MLFNSYFFIFIFLPIALIAWWAPRRLHLRLALLVLASYAFYAWWDWRFCGLMFAVTCSDYLASRQIIRAATQKQKKRWLVGTLAFNLGLLAYFKYAGFFAQSINEGASTLGWGAALPALKILLPLGISFYIFESLSYTIDIYRGIARPARSFLHYMLFISIFPKLIAGPIIRYTDVEQQYLALRDRVDYGLAWRGVLFFVVGLTKKVLIADKAAAVAAPMLALPHPSFVESWTAIGTYTLQIYFDFSGYSDMAVGLGFMLGFRFPQNFNRPYMATNITEFWDRWHITLSRWLRDYLFIPLGGSRHGRLKTVRNLMIVMFLGGLWHGAAWTFVLWGVYHGLLLGGYHTWTAVRGPSSRWSLSQWPARGVTLVFVMIGWALFVSPSIAAAGDLLGGMAGLHGFGSLWPFARVSAGEVEILNPQLADPAYLVTIGLGILAGIAWVLFLPEVWDWNLQHRPRLRHGFATAAVAVLCIGSFAGFSPFIYYQF